MAGFTRVTKQVGCDRNVTYHDMVERLDEVKINYNAQPYR
jgi:hypothetical protein